LPKKSWNVYSAENRARVARDKALAEATARDAERERKDRDSEATIGLLRDRAHSIADESRSKLSEQDKLLLEATKNLRDSTRENRKRKRLPGEDDTDRDLRYAKERGDGLSNTDKAVVRLRPSKEADAAAPITDRRGNINLFPETRPEVAKHARQSEQDKERGKRKAEEENYGMHLKDAWGRKDTKGAWYLDKDGAVKDAEGRDVWGNEDAHRHERQTQRVNSSDPLAFMNKAQKQLKEVQRDRKERETELEELMAKHSREKDEFENFSLDGGPSSQYSGRRPGGGERQRKHGYRHHHRQRSKSRERDRKRKGEKYKDETLGQDRKWRQ
jgi:hypothetical protein